MANNQDDELVKRLEDHAKHFDKMLEFISVDVYYPTEISEEDWAKKRFAKNTSNKAPKLEVKQSTKKARKARLNPANFKTVPDVQKEALEEKEAEEASKGQKRKRADSDSELSPEPEPQNPLELLSVEPGYQQNTGPKPSRADLKELRDRLQERIAMLRAKRGADKEPETQAPPKKKQKKKEKKDKKKEKNKTKGNTVKGSTTQEGANHVAQGNGVVNDNAKPTGKRKRSDEQAPSVKTETKETKPKKQKKSDEADIRYGALEFKTGAPLPESLVKKKKVSKKQLLFKLEREQEKKEKTNGDKSVLAQKSWDKIMTKAKGEKVKDDVNLLKKAVKKEEKKKKKSKKAWEDRQHQVEKRKDIKQKRRNANIEEFKAKKKEKRIAKRTGTKLKRPGFEGKKKKFLNK